MADIALPYFLARPAAPDPGPAVVVIHEANGVSTQLMRFSQRLAAEGYTVLAPDLFFRSGGTEAADYPTLVAALDPAQTHADLESCAATLKSMGATSVGVTGFCMGGTWSYHMAVASTAFDAAGAFYGSGVAKELGTPNCPTTVFFGAQDQWIPTADIEATVAHHADTVVYADAGHGFMRDGAADYRPEAAADAWRRLLALFSEHLH